jgi:hypothetical protein
LETGREREEDRTPENDGKENEENGEGDRREGTLDDTVDGCNWRQGSIQLRFRRKRGKYVRVGSVQSQASHGA